MSFSRALVLVLAAWLAAFAVGQAAEPLPTRPQRVISLAPNLTELVAELDAASQLAGISQYSNFPPQVQHLPRVGSYYRPDFERILALRPDLCLAIEDGNPKDLLEKLEAMKIPVLLLKPQSIEGLRQSFIRLGDALGRQQEAAQAVIRMDLLLGKLDALRKACPQNGRKRTLLVLQHKPLIVSARGGYLDELANLAGALNPVEAPMPYPRLSVEAVLELKPEVVLRVDMQSWTHPGSIQPTNPDPLLWPEAKEYLLNPDLFARPSLRSLEAAQALVPLLCGTGQSLPEAKP